METRKAKLIIGKAGGTAGKGSKTYKIAIPSKWVRDLLSDGKDVELTFDGKSITLTPPCDVERFTEEKKKLRHKLIRVRVYDGGVLCSEIVADTTDRTVKHRNFTGNRLKTPFGNNENPDYSDFENFLAERCIPEGRDGLREYLGVLGIDTYDPIEIVRKTKGVMAEDNFYLETEEL
ncbi:MAG: hypothetical protein KBT31_04850 [Firmicutes bacterium]|nr:hypothetical protein [Candidatus Colimorpha enterica]